MNTVVLYELSTCWKQDSRVHLFLCPDSLSGGISVDCTTPRGSRGTGSFTCSVAVYGLVAAGRGCPDDFSRCVTNCLTLVAKRDGSQ